MPPALQFLVLTFTGWVNRHQDDLIEYLREENRVLREYLGPRPLRLTDAQRRRLAVRGHKLGRRVLRQVAGIVTPDTILRWYRRLIAKKYDGSACRRRGRPMTRSEVAALVVRMAVENPQWGYTRIRDALLEPRAHDRPDHGEADLARPRDRPGSRTEPTHALEDVPTGALGRLGGLRSVHGRGADAGRAQAVSCLLRDRAADPPRDHRRDPSATGRRVDGAAGPQSDPPGRWLPADCAASDSRPRSPLHSCLWRDPDERRRSADPTSAEESQSQCLCRAVRPVDQGGVSQSSRPTRRGSFAPHRPRVRRALPSREKPSGTRQPAPATTATSAKAGRRRSAAGAPRWTAQLLLSRGRMSGRLIKRTLRGLGRRHHDPRPSRTGRTIERERVVGRIRRHSGEVSIHLVDQTDPRHRVIGRRLSQRAGHDHTGPVHAEMELPPAASPSAPMCRRGPLTVADDGQSGAVNDEVPAGARAGAPKREGEMLTASRGPTRPICPTPGSPSRRRR